MERVQDSTPPLYAEAMPNGKMMILRDLGQSHLHRSAHGFRQGVPSFGVRGGSSCRTDLLQEGLFFGVRRWAFGVRRWKLGEFGVTRWELPKCGVRRWEFCQVVDLTEGQDLTIGAGGSR